MEISCHKLKKRLIFLNLQSPKIKNFLYSFSNIGAKEVSYTFSYKEAKFSKSKYFLIIIMKRSFLIL